MVKKRIGEEESYRIADELYSKTVRKIHDIGDAYYWTDDSVCSSVIHIYRNRWGERGTPGFFSRSGKRVSQFNTYYSTVKVYDENEYKKMMKIAKELGYDYIEKSW
ncbi:MAG: hypothetical protein IMZ52_06245 [Actinobacteria bacterium]|nr:hypothetical protein [Actinomycetota bacterium]MBE3114666.1 hypothetical protein [Actinomycetota bacterium]